MENTNLENLNRLAKLFGTDRLISPEEIQQIFKGIVEILATYKKDTSSINEDTKSVVNKLLEDVISIHRESINAVEEKKKVLDEGFTDKLSELRKYIDSVKAEMDKEDEMPEGDTDDEAEKQALVEEIMAQIKLPEYQAAIVSGEDIIDRINGLDLSDDNKIDYARLKNVPQIKGKVISGSPTVISNAVDLDGSTRQAGYAIVWDADRGRYTHAAGGGGGGSGDVVGPSSSTNNNVALFDGTTGKLIKDSGLSLAGNNTGDQTSIVGITGTKAQFDTAVTDGNFLYVGDVTQYTDEMAQDTVGGMVDSSLVYSDATPSLSRAALTGDVTASAGSNTTAIKNDVALGGSPTTTTQSAGDNTTKIATTAFVTTAVANGTVGLLDYRGSYDASTNLFPATGGSGLAGAILKGDFYICSVGGTLGGTAVTPGDLIIAIVDTPGQTSGNWDLIEHNLGAYVSDVTGTTNRITSSGGATPSIDISSTFEALLGKVANPLSQFAASTSAAIGVGTVELGHASDTTLSRSSAGVLAVEGVVIPSISSTNTLTNKRMQPRTASSTTASTLTPDLSSANVYYRTTQTATLTINAPTGTPVIGETIAIYVDSAGAQTLTMDSTYKVFGEAFPATTTAGKTLMITAQFNGTDWKTLWATAI
jgi:hypothetical protein